MKVMKKYFKVVLCFLAFAVCSFLLAFSPTITAVTAMNYAVANYNVVINSIKMPTKVVDVSANNKFLIPLLSTALNGNCEKQIIRVIDPAGTAHDYDVTDTSKSVAESVLKASDKNFFTGIVTEDGRQHLQVKAMNNGKYKIVYIVTSEDDRTYYSNTYEVTVKNVSYELDFTKEDGKQHLFKSEVKAGSDLIEIPAISAKVIGGTDSVVLSPKTHVIVTKNNVEQTLDATNSDFISKKVDVNATPENVEDDVTKYYINPTEANSVYTIQYTYEEATNRPTKTFTIKVSENFTKPQKLTVNNPTLPAMELGKTGITLPKLTVNSENAKNVAHNVTKIVIEKENNSDIKYTLPANTYKFDFTKENFAADSYDAMVGVYKITYFVEDAYGVAKDYVIKTQNSVTATSKPQVYLSYDYEVDLTKKNDTDSYSKVGESGYNNFTVKADAEVDTDASTSLKANYGYGEILVPAIYGTDNVTKTEDLIFIRILRNANTRTAYYVDNIRYNDVTNKVEYVKYGESGYNYALNTIEGKTEDNPGTITNKQESIVGNPNMAANFRFTEDGNDADEAGTYYLEYKVISNKVKERTGTLYVAGTTSQYSITVLKEATYFSTLTEAEKEKLAPTVEIINLKDSSVLPENSVKITVNPSDKNDTRLKTATFYYTKIDTTIKTDAKTLQQDIEDAIAAVNATTKNYTNVLNKEEFISAMQAKGYVNFDIADETEIKNSFEIENLENLYNKYSYDASTWASEYENLFLFDGNAYVKNEEATYDDQKTYYVKADKVIVAAVTLNDSSKVAVDDVTLSLKNTTEKSAPVATITNSGDIESGTGVIDLAQKKQAVKIKLPTLSYADDDANLQLNVMYYIDKPESTTGLNYRYPSGVTYSANEIDGGYILTSETGVYYVVYTAIDAAGNTTVSFFTFEVVDSSKPILAVNVKGDNITQAGNTVTAEVGSTIDFETLVRSSDGKNDYSSTADITFKVDDNGLGLDYRTSGKDGYSYIFNSVGTYTITVSATQSGLPAADGKIIVLEITKPNLEWLTEFDIPQYATRNETVILPDIAASHDAVVSVNVKAPGGAAPTAGNAEKITLENGISVWSFTTNASSKGTYTITYTATTKDAAIEKTFNIKVGDNVAPVFKTFKYKNELKQDIVYTGSNIEYIVEQDKPNKTMVITVKRDGETVYSYNLGIVIDDKDDVGTTTPNMSWTNFNYEVTGTNITKNSDGKYTITGTGEVALKLKVTDGYDNVTEETIYFNVVSKADAEEVDNTVVGTVLIIISLVVLAGVILFFTFTGTKGKGGKIKAKKEVKEVASKEEKVEAVEAVEEEKTEVVEETVEEVKAEETEQPKAEEISNTEEPVEEKTEENNGETEAKEGDVE